MELRDISNLISNRCIHEAKSELDNYFKRYGGSLDAYNLLGLVYIESGDLVRARLAFENAVQLNANHFRSLFNLALTHVRLENFNDAIEFFLKSERLSPQNIEVLNAIGNTYRITGHLNLAERYLLKAKRLAPENPYVAENFARLLLQKGAANDAIAIFENLSSSFPHNIDLKMGLIECLIKLDRLQEAEDILSKILSLKRNNYRCAVLYSILEKRRKNSTKQIDWLKIALEIKPSDSKALCFLAKAYIEIGNVSMAQSLLLEIIQKQTPECGEAYFQLLNSCRYRLSTDQVAKMEDAVIQYPKSYWLHFAAAKHFENENNLNLSVDYLRIARELFSEQKQPKTKNRPFEALLKCKKNNYRKLFTGSKFIFVIGMPRSGTTLTDQILDSHPDVDSLGESGLVASLAAQVQQITNLPYFIGVEQLEEKQKQTLLQKTFAKLHISKPIVVDTTPNNVFYVSFILSLLPDAEVVICRRSPKDTCLSIYKHPLLGQEYANNPDSLVSQIIDTNQLIEHWLTEFKGNCIELIYEHLVNEPAKTIYNLLKLLNLTFSDTCLTPQNNTRAVHTPSSIQVRQPINSHSVQTWKSYEALLPELFIPLDELELLHAGKINAK